MFTGRVVRVFPEQKYGIAVPFGARARTLGLKEVILFGKDQRARNETGQIDPEKVRTTILKMGTIVKFLLDYKSGIVPIAFLWTQKIEANTGKATVRAMSMDGKKPKGMAHNYPQYEQFGNSPGEIETTPGKVQQEKKPVPEIAHRPVPDSVKKEVIEASRDAKQETAAVARQEKPIFVRPKPESRRNDSNHSNNGPNRKVDGTRKPQGKKRHNGPNYPIYGRDFRYLARDVGATPMPSRVFQKSIPEVPGVPKKGQTGQNDSVQVKKPDSVPNSSEAKQESEKGIVMPSRVAEEGVKALLGGQRVRIGAVGG